MWGIAIFGELWGPENQCGIPWFFMISWISESFSLYLLDKSSFNFKLFFFHLIGNFRGYHQKKYFIFRLPLVSGDIDAKKRPEKLSQTLHKHFSHCLIVISSLLWAFMIQNLGENSCSGGKSTKYGVPVVRISFFLQKAQENCTFS